MRRRLPRSGAGSPKPFPVATAALLIGLGALVGVFIVGLASSTSLRSLVVTESITLADDATLSTSNLEINGTLTIQQITAFECLEPPCLVLDAFTSAVITPAGGSPSGAFSWPTPDGQPQTASKRSVVPVIPVFPTANLGGVFPPPDAIPFESGSAALSQLAGKAVFNTTIFFNPGTYTENLIVDGFSSGSSFSGAANGTHPRSIHPQGLVLVGDPRVIVGMTWFDCARNQDGSAYRLANGDAIAPFTNSIIGLSTDTVRLDTCDAPLSGVPPDKTSCSSTGPDFDAAGIVPGDVAVVFDRVSAEFYELPISGVSGSDLTFDLSNSALSNITDVFSAAPATPQQCGASLTIMPNRIIQGVGASNPGNQFPDGPPDSPVAVVALNRPVTMYGFWIKQPGNGLDTSLNDNFTSSTLAVQTQARVGGVVVDGRGTAVTNSLSRESPLFINGDGFLTDRVNSASFLSNDTVDLTGFEDISGGSYLPVTVLGSSDDDFSTLVRAAPHSRLEMLNLALVASDCGLSCDSARVSIGALYGSALESSSRFVLNIGTCDLRTFDVNAFGFSTVVSALNKARVSTSTIFAFDCGIVVDAREAACVSASTMVFMDTEQRMHLDDMASLSLGGTTATSPTVSEGTLTQGYGAVYTSSGNGEQWNAFQYSGNDQFRAAYKLHEFASTGNINIFIPCSALISYRYKEFHVYDAVGESGSTHRISLSGPCPGVDFGALGTTVDFDGSIGSGISFVIMNGYTLVLNAVGVS